MVYQNNFSLLTGQDFPGFMSNFRNRFHRNNLRNMIGRVGGFGWFFGTICVALSGVFSLFHSIVKKKPEDICRELFTSKAQEGSGRVGGFGLLVEEIPLCAHVCVYAYGIPVETIQTFQPSLRYIISYLPLRL